MKQNMRGYTLIEMVVVAGLVGMLSVGIVSVFISTIQGSKRAKLQAVVKVQGDYAMASMERTLRNAVKFPSTCSSDTLTFQIKNQITGFDTVVYSFANESLLMNGNAMIGSGSSQVQVLSGSFTCTQGSQFDLGTVAIAMTLRAVGDSTTQTDQAFQTTIAIRAQP